MRDPRLNQAIHAAGGISALARRLGIAPPSVSNWTKVPSERVLAVESATGIRREMLRPDLYDDFPAMSADVDDVDLARAQEYALLALLLSHAPDDMFLQRLASLQVDANPLG